MIRQVNNVSLGSLGVNSIFESLLAFFILLFPDICFSWTLDQTRIIEAGTVRVPILGPSGLFCSSYDQSICVNTTEFYTPKKLQVSRVSFITAITNRLGVRVQVTEGADAPKVSIQDKIQLGLVLSGASWRGTTSTIEFYGSFGGKIIRQPCIDSYDREYSCTTLTAWSDYQEKIIRMPDYGARITVRY